MDGSEKVQDLPLLSAKFQSAEAPSYEIHLYRDYLKRVFDLILAILLLPLVAPLLLLLMILIKLDSRGPAIYRSERIGKGGKKFDCLKLRSMCMDAQSKLEALLDSDDALKNEYQTFCKLKNDPRVTRVGRFLRSSSLDELPQIFNVIKGDMSFVGPRPAFEVEIPKYGMLIKDYKSVLPGITGMWQVNGRNEMSFDKRVHLDSIYGRNLNFIFDCKIILKTLPAALKRTGAY